MQERRIYQNHDETHISISDKKAETASYKMKIMPKNYVITGEYTV